MNLQSEKNTIVLKDAIIEEINKILSSDVVIKDDDCISLYDIANVIDEVRDKQRQVERYYDKYVEYGIRGAFLSGFDYEKEALIIGNYLSKESKRVDVYKKGDEMIFDSQNELFKKDVINSASEIISKAYDELMKFKDSATQSHFKFHAINSDFLIDISWYGVDICVRSPYNRFMNFFELRFNKYGYAQECDSISIVNAVKGNEAKIFKKIFVKIEDCPEWMRETLYDVRQKELKEEEKKEKRLELKRKIFPWKIVRR